MDTYLILTVFKTANNGLTHNTMNAACFILSWILLGANKLAMQQFFLSLIIILKLPFTFL